MSHSSRFSQRAPSTLKGARLVPSARTTNWILHYTATKKPFLYSISEKCAASVPISTFMCLWAIYTYIPRMGPLYFLQKNRQIDCGNTSITNSLTDTWLWKLRMWPRNSFFENICFEFSELVLRSIQLRPYIWRNYTVHMEAKPQFHHWLYGRKKMPANF